MASIRISGNWRNANEMEWAGAPTLDRNGHIERSIALPEEALQAIERDVAKGGIEGTTYLPNGTHFNWFVDR